ncbi:MAG: PKD domain-containing protein [Chitinophagales bacterium]
MKQLLLLSFCLLFSICNYAGVGVGSTHVNESEIVADINIVETAATAFLDRAPIYDKDVCKLDMLFDLTIEGLTVTFKNKAVGEYSNVEWTFGDGAISETKDIQHTYKKSGIYYFTVMIHNTSTGCIDFIGGNYYLQATNQLHNPQKITQEEVNQSKILNLE